MSNQFVEFTTDKQFIRRVRELKTIQLMISMYCSSHHHGHGNDALCADCSALFDYAQRRLQRCVFGDAKPNCAKCVVHCYNKDMRERIRVVMRWAGPRMLLRHPVLGILHLLADRRPVPMLPTRHRGSEHSRNDEP
ncbi:nitrous oxide-stimulated promoter family protein [Rhodoferax sp.]|uniref:nitrous oxide-stimulated promoter family protein n=1 Tax=Rhodoferax sp. TaxID=50421 RepID=UPI0025CD8B5F|nr:nitrous oxide-stimulated promoter family protein [Rhodoferax sp.]MCM2342913.1 nitrous oxide-stimulated promoter family protein [Rhodoferax sp.]